MSFARGEGLSEVSVGEESKAATSGGGVTQAPRN